MRRFLHAAVLQKLDAGAASAIDDSRSLAELRSCVCKTDKMGLHSRKQTRRVPESGDRAIASDGNVALSLRGGVDPPPARPKPRRRRSGGVLLAASPDGLVMDVCEFFDAESVSQRYMFLSRVKAHFPSISVVVHDDACHLRRFAERRQGVSAAAARLAPPSLAYFVDRFHSTGHVDPWCRANCSPACPAGQAALAGVDTSRCEQMFRIFNRFKHSFRSMKCAAARYYLHEMSHFRNEHHLATRPLRSRDGGATPAAAARAQSGSPRRLGEASAARGSEDDLSSEPPSPTSATSSSTSESSS